MSSSPAPSSTCRNFELLNAGVRFGRERCLGDHVPALGAFFIGALNNGMSLMDITEFYQKDIKGVIIILAVWFDQRGMQRGGRK